MAGRIRTIKPEWLEDELIVMASSDARVLSISLILLADDYGNGRARVRWLRGQIFPDGTDAQTEIALKELVEIGFVELYENNNQQYFHLRNWEKHQKVSKPGRPRVPAPNEASSYPIQPPDSGTPQNSPGEPTNPHESPEFPGGTSEKPNTSTMSGTCERAKPPPANPQKSPRIPTNPRADHDHDHDPDHEVDHDHDRRGRSSRGTPSDPSAKVPCPPDLALDEPTLANLETSRAIPRWGAEAILARFALAAAQDPSDLRLLSAWRKCAIKAICGDWGDPKRRPSKPTERTTPKDLADAKQRQRSREERERRLADERLGIVKSGTKDVPPEATHG